ncbi:MAG TPA: hypothetical protein QGH10_02055 [Armatimonadota bacterium]|nr:hypothetical protein [Armatimonadota bacterium]
MSGSRAVEIKEAPLPAPGIYEARLDEIEMKSMMHGMSYRWTFELEKGFVVTGLSSCTNAAGVLSPQMKAARWNRVIIPGATVFDPDQLEGKACVVQVELTAKDGAHFANVAEVLPLGTPTTEPVVYGDKPETPIGFTAAAPEPQTGLADGTASPAEDNMVEMYDADGNRVMVRAGAVTTDDPLADQ